MTWRLKRPGHLIGAFVALVCAQLATAQSVEDLYEAGERRILQAQAQQEEINAIMDDTEDLFEEYQLRLREIADLEIYNNLLRAQVNAQRNELADLYQAIDDVGAIERQILPLMTRMIAGLERFIELDLPFLVEQRLQRVTTARDTLRRSDVTVAEQFRYVLEAWRIEMDEYGRRGDIYTDEIEAADGVTRQVELLQIGRVALIYLTRDGTQAGAWDQRNRRWVALDETLLPDIQAAFEAYRTETPAMFIVPVPAPEEG